MSTTSQPVAASMQWFLRQVAALRWPLAFVLVAGCASRGEPQATPVAPAPLDEPSLLARMRAEVKAAPPTALSLADEGERRFGESPLAEERRALAVQALINLDRMGAARSRAYEFLERYPGGPYSANIAAMTGVHLTPGGPAPSRH
jgi:hypothetical protein